MAQRPPETNDRLAVEVLSEDGGTALIAVRTDEGGTVRYRVPTERAVLSVIKASAGASPKAHSDH